MYIYIYIHTDRRNKPQSVEIPVTWGSLVLFGSLFGRSGSLNLASDPWALLVPNVKFTAQTRASHTGLVTPAPPILDVFGATEQNEQVICF